MLTSGRTGRQNGILRRSLPLLQIVAGSYLSLPTLFLKTKFLDSSLLAGKRESRLTAAAPATDRLSISALSAEARGRNDLSRWSRFERRRYRALWYDAQYRA